MPKVKINKQLTRPDGGNISSGSLAVCNNPQQVVNEMKVVFLTSFFITETAYDNGKTSIPQIVQFPKFKLVKECNEDEWTALNDNAGAGALVGQFMQEVIDDVIGVGFTEIIE